MRRLLLLLMVVTAIPAHGPPLPKIQTLIITGRQEYHDWRATTPHLRMLLEETGRFEVRVTEEFRGAGPETLAPYDLAVVNYYDFEKVRWGERAEAAFLEFVSSGKGAVIYHYSVGAFEGWVEYEKLCGANWRPDNGRHSPRHDFRVEIEDTKHPITRGLEDFTQYDDELYANLRWQPSGTYRVLATAWDDYSRYEEKVRSTLKGKGKKEPVLWTVKYGNGRVFVTVLGHHVPAMRSGFAGTFARGAEWAATGNIAIAQPSN